MINVSIKYETINHYKSEKTVKKLKKNHHNKTHEKYKKELKFGPIVFSSLISFFLSACRFYFKKMHVDTTKKRKRKY